VIKKLLTVVAASAFLLSLGLAPSTAAAGGEPDNPHCGGMGAACWGEN
jgi:Spy/CpxP family protein refolding chaperone